MLSDEELIEVHKDIEDVSQMIHFPKLKTSVKDDQTGNTYYKV